MPHKSIPANGQRYPMTSLPPWARHACEISDPYWNAITERYECVVMANVGVYECLTAFRCVEETVIIEDGALVVVLRPAFCRSASRAANAWRWLCEEITCENADGLGVPAQLVGTSTGALWHEAIERAFN